MVYVITLNKYGDHKVITLQRTDTSLPFFLCVFLWFLSFFGLFLVGEDLVEHLSRQEAMRNGGKRLSIAVDDALALEQQKSVLVLHRAPASVLRIRIQVLRNVSKKETDPNQS